MGHIKKKNKGGGKLKTGRKRSGDGEISAQGEEGVEEKNKQDRAKKERTESCKKSVGDEKSAVVEEV